MTDGFSVRFWGVRGSIACPGPSTVRYGGNTSCVEVSCGEHRFILDAGTGLRELGNEMMREAGGHDADLLLSHTHFDHICGLPFFGPMFVKSNRFRVWAGHLLPERTIEHVLRGMMVEPLFPAPVDVFEADIEYKDFRMGETLEPQPGVQVRTAPLNHPNGATGYRFDYDGRSACYITDTEHTGEGIDENIVGLVRGAELMIYDATYEDHEYPRYKGWGHSTWQEGVRVADAAEVKTLVIFHHDPNHDDATMDEIARQAEEMRPGTLVAREGMILVP